MQGTFNKMLSSWGNPNKILTFETFSLAEERT